MAFVLFVLLLLGLHCQLACSRSITISDDGNDSSGCCLEGWCHCSSLERALQKIEKDTTLINITSSQVFLPNNVTVTNHNVINIVGNMDTVIACNYTVYVTFLNCKNVSISGITWDRCGGAYLAGAVLVNHTDNFLVSTCKFQNSLAYGIAIQAVSGFISIVDTEILNNSVSPNSAGGLHLQQTTEDAQLEVNIVNCSFKFNGYKSYGDGSDGGAIKVDTVGVTSMLSLSIENSVISNNHAYQGAGIFMNTSANNLTIKFSNVTFINNSAYSGGGDSIYFFILHGENASFFLTGGSSIIGDSYGYLHFVPNVTSIVMEDVTIDHNGEGYMVLHIETFSETLTISFSDTNLLRTSVNFVLHYTESCFLEFNKLIVSHNSSLQIDESESKGFQCSITNCQFLNNSGSDGNDVGVLNIINKHPYDPNGNPAITQIVNSSFENNNYGSSVVNLEFSSDKINAKDTSDITRIINSSFTGNNHGSSVVAIRYDNDNGQLLGDVRLSSTIFANNIDNDNTLYLHYCNLTISKKVSFVGNTAIKGAGIYFTNFSTAVIDSHAHLEFTDNTAALGGGAIYAEFPSFPMPSYCKIYPWFLFYSTGECNAIFTNNRAHAAGDSIFISIPSDEVDCVCKNSSSSDSLMYIPAQFNYSGSKSSNEIATSPYNLQLGPPAICNGSCTDGGTYQVEGVMLGEQFSIVARMLDYYDNTAEPTLFQIRCSENCQHYNLNGSDNFEYKFIETNKSVSISIIGDKVKTDSIIGLEMSSVIGTINSNVRTITVKIEVTIIPCQIGYVYDSVKQACLCNSIDDIVECELDSILIKWGYWYGKIGNTIVVGSCPNNYCKYGSSCKSSEKLCDLSEFSDDQCNLHRTGPACGKCQDNYTLAYDSIDCVPDSHCSAWWTAGIVILTVIYWLTVSLTIIFMMYFITAPTLLGYVYGITYFYSVIDLFVSNDLPISDGMVKFIEILSGLVNLTPRFLGSLCLVKGLSGIDQQVIHYVHPVAIALLLFLIPKLVKCYERVSYILNRVGTVRSMCLLLLLCYTSISSTSLNLLRPLVFQGTHTLYAYYSPDIEYFTGRHIVYGIVAILLAIVTSLGLPVFLLLQPLLRRCQWIQFIRIQHILDQFQQCYKKEYHWAAAIYLICRLLIFVIVSLNTVEYVTSFFVLQVLCFVVAVMHILLRPYKDDTVNSLDHIILLNAVMVVGLNTNSLFVSLSTDRAVNDFVVAMFVLLPLISFIGFLVLKKFIEKFSRLARCISYLAR